MQVGQTLSKAIFRGINDARLNHIEIAGSSYSPPPEVKKAVVKAKMRETAPDKRIEVPVAPPPAVRLANVLKKNKPAGTGTSAIMAVSTGRLRTSLRRRHLNPG